MDMARWRLLVAVELMAAAAKFPNVMATINTIGSVAIHRVLQEGGNVSAETSIDPSALEPRVASYRNAYGSQFVCGPTCALIAAAYVTLASGLLFLLFLIPVRHPESSKLKIEDVKQATVSEPQPPQPGLWSIIVAWLGHRLLPRGATVHDEDGAQDNYAPLAQRSPTTRYRSVDDGSPDRGSSLGFQDDVMTVDDTERLFDSPSRRLRRGPKRPSIFSSLPSSPAIRRGPSERFNSGPSSPVARQGASETRIVSELSFASAPASPSSLDITIDFIEQHRHMTLSGSQQTATESKEEMVRAVERRASIQHRAEKRKEKAKSDIAIERLANDEVEMYEYLEFVRELLEGVVIKKVCQSSSKVVKRTFYIDAEMTTVFWNKLATRKWVSKKSSISVSKIDKVLKGLEGNPQLATKADRNKSHLYVSVVCSDGKRLDLEAKDEGQRQRLFIGFSRLAMEKQRGEQEASPGAAETSREMGSSERAESSELPRSLGQASPTSATQLEHLYEEKEEEKGGAARS